MATPQPHPPNAEMIRGPKSRAGLKPACVSGAITDISAPTVAPITGGIIIGCSDVVLFLEFVTLKTTKASTAVPNASAKKSRFPRGHAPIFSEGFGRRHARRRPSNDPLPRLKNCNFLLIKCQVARGGGRRPRDLRPDESQGLAPSKSAE
mmetsp:Transcript_41281/g.96807  ORF Transcript_41281/g.96807 Transcript_41281/m.96807 type:complete len:150 (-) Transcript_41281:644-1093(-)